MGFVAKDVIGIHLAPGSSLTYGQGNLPVSSGYRPYRVLRAVAWITGTGPGALELSLLDPAFESGQRVMASSGPIAYGTIPQRIVVNMPPGTDFSPAGRSEHTIINIDCVCLDPTIKNTAIGTLMVYIQYGDEFLSEACPSLRILHGVPRTRHDSSDEDDYIMPTSAPVRL